MSSSMSRAAESRIRMSSEGEYGDVKLRQPVDPAEFVRRLNEACPDGLRLLAATAVERNSPSLTSMVAAARLPRGTRSARARPGGGTRPSGGVAGREGVGGREAREEEAR